MTVMIGGYSALGNIRVSGPDHRQRTSGRRGGSFPFCQPDH